MATIIKQGETLRRTLVFRDKKTGAIPDFFGCTAKAQMRTVPGGELTAEASCSIDIIKGTITALWTADQTDDIPVGNYGFDVWLTCGTERKPVWSEQIQIALGYTEE